MTDNRRRKPFFERLQTGLEEAVEFARGQRDLRNTVVPRRPPAFSAREVRRLRRRCKMSQALFARLLNLSPKTVQAWEQGQRHPSQAALRLLQVLREKPDALFDAAGVKHAARRNDE